MNVHSKQVKLVAPLALFGLIVLASIPLLGAAPAEQRTFATPDEAIQTLIHASERHDTAALVQIFGREDKEIVQSGDPAEDRSDQTEFVQQARKKLRINTNPATPDLVTFSIGESDWPFPVPLVRQDRKWHFDSSKGKVEVLAHRIGENELDTEDVCRAFVEAQFEYATKAHDGSSILQYAQRIAAMKGKDDGLYGEDSAKKLVPLSFARATVSENLIPEPYHGYYFRILKEQGPDAPGGTLNYVVDGKMIGGFALIASPAEYGSTGIQTFMVNQEGIVYAKDLGPDSASLAAKITAFNPDQSWHAVQLD